MKTINLKQTTVVATIAALIMTATAGAHFAPPPFYDELDPHGAWISWEGGVQVWQPRIAGTIPDWRPYYHDGYWAWTGNAWIWHSAYPWGTVVFHYGNWWQAPGIGWVWVPGTVYAPAWVQWRYSGHTWGWAPMPPPAPLQTRLSYSFYRTWGGSYNVSFSLTPSHYVFVPVTSFGGVSLTSMGVYGSHLHFGFSSTRTVSCGPSPYSVGRYSRSGRRRPHGTIEQPVAVAPTPAWPSRQTRHPASPTPSRHPAPPTLPRVRRQPQTVPVQPRPSPRMESIRGSISARVPQRPAVSAPSRRAVPTPSRPAVSVPNRPTVNMPSRRAVPTPNRPAMTVPNRPAVSAPSRPATPAPNRNALTAVARAASGVSAPRENASGQTPTQHALPASGGSRRTQAIQRTRAR